MTNENIDYTRALGRNVPIGLGLVYAVTTGLSYAAIGHLGQALAIAGVPTVFAGPYLGLLITLISADAPKRAADAPKRAVDAPKRAVDLAQPAMAAASVALVRDAAPERRVTNDS